VILGGIMSYIKVDGKNLSLDELNNSLKNSTVEFSLWGGRKIVLLNNGTKLKVHFNKILDSLLRADPDSGNERASLRSIATRLRVIKDEGHINNSPSQKIYNLFRRLMPNIFRESKLNQLDDQVKVHEENALLRLGEGYVDQLMNEQEAGWRHKRGNATKKN
jgi:hypothetical protein